MRSRAGVHIGKLLRERGLSFGYVSAMSAYEPEGLYPP